MMKAKAKETDVCIAHVERLMKRPVWTGGCTKWAVFRSALLSLLRAKTTSSHRLELHILQNYSRAT